MSQNVVPISPTGIHIAETYYQDNPRIEGSILEEKVPLDIKYHIFFHVPLKDMVNIFCLNKYFNSLFFPDQTIEKGNEIINSKGFRAFLCRNYSHLMLPFSQFHKIFTQALKLKNSNDINSIISVVLPIFDRLRKNLFQYLMESKDVSNSELYETFKTDINPKDNAIKDILYQIERARESMYFPQELLLNCRPRTPYGLNNYALPFDPLNSSPVAERFKKFYVGLRGVLAHSFSEGYSEVKEKNPNFRDEIRKHAVACSLFSDPFDNQPFESSKNLLSWFFSN